MYPPKVVKSPRFGKLREIRRPFFDLDHEKWKPQVSQQIARNLLNSPTNTANHAKSVQFMLISKTPCSLSVTQFLQQITQNPPNLLILRANHAEINKIRTNFKYSSTCFLDTHKTGSNTLLVRITRISQP